LVEKPRVLPCDRQDGDRGELIPPDVTIELNQAAGRRFNRDIIRPAIALDIEFLDLEILRVRHDRRSNDCCTSKHERREYAPGHTKPFHGRKR